MKLYLTLLHGFKHKADPAPHREEGPTFGPFELVNLDYGSVLTLWDPGENLLRLQDGRVCYDGWYYAELGIGFDGEEKAERIDPKKTRAPGGLA